MKKILSCFLVAIMVTAVGACESTVNSGTTGNVSSSSTKQSSNAETTKKERVTLPQTLGSYNYYGYQDHLYATTKVNKVSYETDIIGDSLWITLKFNCTATFIDEDMGYCCFEVKVIGEDGVTAETLTVMEEAEEGETFSAETTAIVDLGYYTIELKDEK